MRVFLTIILFVFVGSCYSQDIDCDKWIIVFKDTTFTRCKFNTPPIPVNGYESLLINPIKKRQKTKNDNIILVAFVVDTMGNTHCHFVENGTDVIKEKKAIEKIKSTKFIPAHDNGKLLIEDIILPVEVE